MSLCFRTVAPARGGVSSEQATQINLRRLKINAQIKAMISIVESAFNFGRILILYFMTRSSNGILAQVITLYMVILPYAFLMNTSHNKDRIVADGWRNVFRNLLGRYNHTDDTISLPLNQDCNTQQKKKAVSKDEEDGKNNPIFVTSDEPINNVKNIGPSTITEPFYEQPSTSKNAKQFEKGPLDYLQLNAERLQHSYTTYSSESYMDIKEKLKQQITELRLRIFDEEDYLESFKCLVSYYNDYQVGNVYFAPNSDDSPSQHGIYVSSRLTKNIKKRNMSSKALNEDVNKKDKKVDSLQIADHHQNLIPRLKDTLHQRAIMRGAVLESIYNPTGMQETSWENLIERLIDLEESLVVQ